MTVSEEAHAATSVKRKTLLEKYDIPVNHLDFEYIKKCNNLKEIERIIKILRSNEEGHYPELIECAEEKLRLLNPNHQLLRVQTQVLTKSSFSKSEWNDLTNEIEEWKDEIESKEKNLISGAQKSGPLKGAYPEVRRLPKPEVDNNNAKKNAKNSDRISSTNYKDWDKYDADAECLKMEIEEERRKELAALREKEEAEKKERNKGLSKDEQELATVREVASNMTTAERQVFALKEKDLGNEFYKTSEYDKAIRHYTRSIEIMPTAVGYNNRAATYLKQCKYSLALEDTNRAIELDPDNVKAYFRRALSLQHKNEFHLALEDIRQVLKKEPNHVVARHVADQLRDHCKSLPKKVKLVMRDDQPNENNDLKLVEVTEDEMLRDYKDKDFVEVNDFGLPKIMCNCNGRYSNDPGIQHDHRIRFQHLNTRQGQAARAGSGGAVPKAKVEDLTPDNRKTEEAYCSGGRGDEQAKPKRLNIVELDRIVEDDDQEETKIAKDRRGGCKESEPQEETKVKELEKKKTLSESVDKKTVALGETVEERVTPGVVEEETIAPRVTEEDKITLGVVEEATIALGVVKEGKIAPGMTEEEKIVAGVAQKKESALGGAEKEKITPGVADRGRMAIGDRSALAVVEEERSTGAEGETKRSAPAAAADPQEEAGGSESTQAELDDCRIMVAKKYREKVSQPVPDRRPPKRAPIVRHTVVPASNVSPFQFWHTWTSIIKEKRGLGVMARLLRSIRPHLLQAVIGNKLDEIMLSNFLHCLRYQFSLNDESELVTEYLTAIMQLERFKIISSFLSSEDKKLSEDLIGRLGLNVN